ncbi:MAG: phage portal protein, partial [Actinomycetota bacterium]|nr:phage portal protein [Actinomycetota bacterium]
AQNPEYVTWDGKLEASFRELDHLREQLYFVSETTPAAFGQLKQGLAESGSALRRLMMAPLAKVARIRMRFDPALRKALSLAAALERANGRNTPELGEKLRIQWQDGLPPDPREQAETEALRVRSGTTSRAAAIRRLDGGTDQEAQAELDRALEEAEVNRAPSSAGEQ